LALSLRYTFAAFVAALLLISSPIVQARHAARKHNAPQVTRVAGDFSDYADTILGQDALYGASCSIEIYSLTGDSVVYTHDADRLLTPASVNKLLTSSAALDKLGPDYRFSTTCYMSGSLGMDGTLAGNLILQAGGDPVSEIKTVDKDIAPHLRAWADSLSAHGLRHVAGNLVLRTWPCQLESASPRWELGDVQAGFAPPLDGFGFYSNVCHLAVQPGATVGGEASFVIDPPFAPLHVKSSVVTSPARTVSTLMMQVEPEDTSVIISGQIPLRHNPEFFWAPVQDPALYFGRAFRIAMERSGISVDGDVVVDRSGYGAGDFGTVLYVHQSAPLSSVISVMNKESDNYLAEYVLQVLALGSGGVGDRRAGTHAVLNFLQRCGVDKADVVVEDGCGLARQDLISARSLVQLLRAMHNHPYGEAFENTLSVSGKDGTLSGRMGGVKYAGRMKGKTGSMTRVSALAGYLQGNNGELYAIAFMFNNFRTTLPRVRAIQDQILERLVERTQ
jgi:D-alanyl-D-alanine carboxypeptidase/D-alanyl-D-alanine-endopeptidase (penicillin-binding protein 4)